MLLSIKIQDLVLKPELNTDVSQNLGSSLADSQPNLKVAVNAEFFKAQTVNGSFDTKTELGTVTQTRDNTDGSIKFYTGMALADGEPIRQAILIGSIPKGEPMEPARTGIIQNAVASKTAGLTAGADMRR